jgi:hypothetical protein
VLLTSLPADTCINSKVRLADVIQVTPGLSNQRRAAAFARIQSKHIDFVICDSASMKIVCAIELNDKSHDSEKRKSRDAFVRGALAEAQIPFIEIRARRSYNSAEIREQINKAIYIPTDGPYIGKLPE